MKKKSIAGALIMAGMILVSVPLGVNRSFSRLWKDVKDEYYYDSTGYSIWEGLESREDAANNLLTVAKKYVDGNPELDPYIDNLEYRVQVSTPYEDFSAEAEKNAQLTTDAQKLYDALGQVELSEKDGEYRQTIMADFDAEQDKLKRSSYNDKAREYNEKLARFPANLLKGIARVKEAGVFDGTEAEGK